MQYFQGFLNKKCSFHAFLRIIINGWAYFTNLQPNAFKSFFIE